MSLNMIPVVRLKRNSFVNMLSISIVESSVVILVGLSISGLRPKLYIVSRNCLVLLWVSCSNKSMLKSPQQSTQQKAKAKPRPRPEQC